MTAVERRMAEAKEFARRYDGTVVDTRSPGCGTRGSRPKRIGGKSGDWQGDLCLWHATSDDDGHVSAFDHRECPDCIAFRADASQ